MMAQVTPETVFGFITLLILLVGGYVRLMTKIKELEIRLANVEKQDDKIINKLDLIAESITDLRVDLQNKQDKH